MRRGSFRHRTRFQSDVQVLGRRLLLGLHPSALGVKVHEGLRERTARTLQPMFERTTMTAEFNLDDLKAAAARAMEATDLTWQVEPMWLTTPDSHSPGNQLRVYSGRMSSATKSEQVDAISEIIFWLQARRIAQEWHH